ncbi:hypothetical protein KC359_g5832 [Hortaea werneckii]|nr:hypothetical protein KC359_g5832 [Hortaea werneckii]
MLSTDPRTPRLSKAWGQPIQILRQPPISRTHIPTPSKPRRYLTTISNRKPPTPPSLTQRILTRTYYHNPYFHPPPHLPSRATTATIWTLIGLNTAVFALWQYAQHQPPTPLRHPRDGGRTPPPLTTDTLTAHTTLSWPNLHAGRYWTLLTSALSHQEPLHLVFNMLSLNAFATILTRIPGINPLHIILLATGSALAGSLGFLYHDSRRQQSDQGGTTKLIGRTVEGPHRQIARGIPGGAQSGVETPSRSSALGASGIVLGFGAAATCLAPFTRMAVMFLPVPVPLWVLTTVYAAADTYFLDDAGSRTGHAAHLGGTVFGAVFYLVVLRRVER